MKNRFSRVALLAALPFVAVSTLQAAAPPAPSADLGDIDGDGGVSDFYAWNGPLPGPGRMLRQERLPADRTQPDAGKALRVLYSSTSGVGQGAIAVSGMVFLPKGKPPKGGWPIVAWAHGTTGFADVCAPSWTGTSARDKDYLQKWLEAGFAVVATDYEGLGTKGVHPYLIWRSEGRSVLDGVGAALGAYRGRLSNRVVIVGQSQGSGAALGATYLAKDYAPRLKVLGTVATGLVMTFDTPHGRDYVAKSNTLTDPHFMNPGFAMLRIAGIDRALHPDLDPANFVKPAGYALLRTARKACLHDLLSQADKQGLTGQQIFVENLGPIDGTMDANFDFPDGRMPGPIFVGTGLADDMAGTQGQYNAVRAMCAAGTNLQWHTYPGEDHGSAVNVSARDSIPFAKALLEGKPQPSDCASIAPPGPIQKKRDGAD
ncbi:Acetyl esterase/lipase [Novosphingobium sp. CF614]|uniref:lipase family protein n=1 Tax=Novosphingobium sp. CF614 TaxID=1884364 RepID=UPI0008EC039C|nr:lipase family protein [Novosphingobium sp. CF614]SFG00538.1 Acetyl esterase/lipase [Novosphingobium sp. CF614]